jgi:hypothetical protein
MIWILAPFRFVDANVSDKYTVTIFRVEVVMLGFGGVI